MIPKRKGVRKSKKKSKNISTIKIYEQKKTDKKSNKIRFKINDFPQDNASKYASVFNICGNNLLSLTPLFLNYVIVLVYFFNLFLFLAFCIYFSPSLLVCFFFYCCLSRSSI